MVEGLKERSAKALIDAMQDPVMVLDSRGLIVTQNTACSKLFGYPLKDIVDKHFLECGLASTYSIKELRSAKRSLSAAIKEDKGFTFEYEFVTKKGKSVYVLLSGSMLKYAKKNITYVIVLLRDNTESKKTEEALEKQRVWLNGTLSSIGDAVIATDTVARVTFMNPVAESLTGWTSQEAIGHDIHEVFNIINEQTREAVENPVDRVLREGITVGLANHTVLIARDGRELPLDDSGAPIRSRDGTTLGVVLVFRDITERQTAEWIIGERVKRLTCLLGTSELASEPELSVEVFLEGVIKLIPPAWNYPEITCARIVVGEKKFTTPNFRETKWKQVADINVERKREGVVEVYYLEEQPDIDEGPFLREERNLINSIARQVGLALEQKTAERIIQEAREYAENIVETVREPLIVLDADLRVVTANRSFYETFHVAEEATENELLYEMGNRQWDIPKLRELLEEILPTNTVVTDYEVELEFEDIGERMMMLNARRIYREANKTQLVLLAMEDITELKQKEREIQELIEGLEQRVMEQTKELRETHNQLVKKARLAALGQLGAGIGHELRNPLSAIRSAAYFLRLVIEEPSPEVRNSINIIEEEVVISEKIIHNLLSYVRPKPLTRKKVDIKDLIAAVLSTIVIPKKIEVVNQLDEGIPTIQADPDQLEQIFSNLILNAIQAMQLGGRLIIKSWSSRPDSVDVSIADSGVGITQKNMRKLFTPLFTTKAKGIGLGLVIAKTMVEGHGGKIEVRSEPDKGTTFIVRIPVGAIE